MLNIMYIKCNKAASHTIFFSIYICRMHLLDSFLIEALLKIKRNDKNARYSVEDTEG